MLKLRSTWLAGGSALLLVVALSGLAAAAPLVADTSQGFVDLDGNGVADQCEAAVAADPIAAAAAFAAVDTDGDGTISVREAAHSGWVGGKNCNHGGYVSSVAKRRMRRGTPSRSGRDADDGSDGSTRDDRERDRRVDDRCARIRPRCERRRSTRSGRLPGDRARPARRRRPRRHGPERPRQGRLDGRPVRRRRWQELQPRRRRQRGRQEGPRRRRGCGHGPRQAGQARRRRGPSTPTARATRHRSQRAATRGATTNESPDLTSGLFVIPGRPELVRTVNDSGPTRSSTIEGMPDDLPDPSYRALLEVPQLGRVVASMGLARIGQSMVGVALVLFTLSVYDSPALAGIVTFVSVVPGLLLSPDRRGPARPPWPRPPRDARLPGRDAEPGTHRRAVARGTAAGAAARDHRRPHVGDEHPERRRPPDALPGPRPAPALGTDQRGRRERLRGRGHPRSTPGGEPRGVPRRADRDHRDRGAVRDRGGRPDRTARARRRDRIDRQAPDRRHGWPPLRLVEPDHPGPRVSPCRRSTSVGGR